MSTKPYFVSVKHHKEGLISPNWQEQLGRIPGVSLRGSTRRRARILADTDIIERVRELFGENFIVEEETGRSLQ
jgi:hypothetical protein